MRARFGLLAASVFFLVALQLGQSPPPADGPVPPRPDSPAPVDLDQPIPPDQLAAAKLAARAGLGMAANGLARQLGLSNEQKERVGQMVQARFDAMNPADQDAILAAVFRGRKLAQSRQGTPEQWQRIAKEALPAIENIMQVIAGGLDEIKGVLNDEQRQKFEMETEEMPAMMEELLANARQVADGSIKLQPNGQPEGGWMDSGRGLAARSVREVEEEVVEIGPDGAEVRVTIKRLKSSLPDEATVAGDEKYWPAYLKGFIIKFNLDGEQRNQARRILGQALARVREFRDHEKGPLEDARKKLAEAKTADAPAALADAKALYDRLNLPAVAIFHNLKKQLDDLLTPAQRQAGGTRGDLLGRPRETEGKKTD